VATVAELRTAVAAAKTETGALSLVVRAFAAAGHRTHPTTETARDPQVGTVRIYRWKTSPVGDCVLVAGPSVIPEFSLTKDLQDTSSDATFAVPAIPTQIVGAAAKTVDNAIQRGSKSPAAEEATQKVRRSPPSRPARPPPAPEPVVHAAPAAVYHEPEPVHVPSPPADDAAAQARVLAMIRQAVRDSLA